MGPRPVRPGIVYCTKCGRLVFLGDSKAKRLLWRLNPVCSWCRRGLLPMGPPRM